MHPKNRYRADYDFAGLARLEPALLPLLRTAADGHRTLDFGAAEAVYLLNRTLLRRDYNLNHWDIPRGNLVPAVPGRLDYLHALADLGVRPGRVLDVGTGASLIYPILGVGEYAWDFVATDVDEGSLRVARAIVRFNPALTGKVTVRKQTDRGRCFGGVVLPGEEYGASMCNPPFFASTGIARTAARNKWRKLGRRDAGLSFGGQPNELQTPGGEPAFLLSMIRESVAYAGRIGWFTTLVSKRGYLRAANVALARVGARRVEQVELTQGNKQSRLLAWQF